MTQTSFNRILAAALAATPLFAGAAGNTFSS